MSFIDLATLTLHRRTELEDRINQFSEKCDRANDEIRNLKKKAQGFVLQLNCDPSELKDRFLSCMKEIDKLMYLITDFNLAAEKLGETSSTDHTPVLDTASNILVPTQAPCNLLDALSEPMPSTSRACSNYQTPEKPTVVKRPKEDQLLITFSSASCSSESVPLEKQELVANKAQYTNTGMMTDDSNKDVAALAPEQLCVLPAQKVLELDQSYETVIMHIDGAYFWVIDGDIDEVYSLMNEMTKHYKEHHTSLTMEEMKSLVYCAVLDEDCYYRGLFLNSDEDNLGECQVFLVDTGETRHAAFECVQPLAPQYCAAPPYARCCHLAGIDLLYYQDKHLMEKLENFMENYSGVQCTIKIDDNTSESLGVYVTLATNEILNDILIEKGLALAIDKPAPVPDEEEPPTNERVESVLDITQCPEYEDPVEAVTGYHNRDEADICKHYKGGPEKTCFKGSRCLKKHIVKHPDGWTLDRGPVIAQCGSVPLPAPGWRVRVLVTCVCHYDRLYVQLLHDEQPEPLPDFGVILPPVTLKSLIQDMNSPATRLSYKPLTMMPAPGEMVAALYPLDNNWYRARVRTLSRVDQNVEVMYVDYGTVMYVKEDQIRQLEPRFAALPLQGVQCVLAGVRARSPCSRQWAHAKRALAAIVENKTLTALVVARAYDEITIELYDEQRESVAERLAALELIDLEEYEVEEDTNVLTKMIVP